jgi:hypothetical protein
MRNAHLLEVARMARKYFKFKKQPWDGNCVSFLAKDDGWYLTATMRYQDNFTDAEFWKIHQLIRKTDWDTPLFTVRPHEEYFEIRAEVRLPIFTQCWADEDVPHVLSLLKERWSALMPLMKRAREGEDTEILIADAKTALEKLNDLSQ